MGISYSKDYYMYVKEEITQPMMALFAPDNTAIRLMQPL